ncbi:ArsR/SmtB family transcription factor [Microbacterium sp. NPDC057407]|uniref:ArsR/SmtB family transcription factor n=1 Tax=Microbacterium sp. NPDC057407 TaxID=3346120 RepID=UPI003672F618
MTPLASTFRALGHPDRLYILEALLATRNANGASIGEIAAVCGIDRFAASRHLDDLATAGFITTAWSGKRREHWLRSGGFEEIEDWAIRFTP